MQLAFMLEALTVAILVWTHVVAVWQVLLLATILGIASGFDIPMRQSFIVEMVGKDDLMNAIALNSSLFNGARVIGPAIAGFLIGAVGIAWCYFLNSVSYIAVIAGLLMMRLPPRPPRPQTASAWTGFREVLSYLRGDRRLRVLMMLTAILSVFGFPYISMMPVFARDVLHRGATGYGGLDLSPSALLRCRADIRADQTAREAHADRRDGVRRVVDSVRGVARVGARHGPARARGVCDDREQLDHEHNAPDDRPRSPAGPHHGVLLVRVRGDGAVRGVSVRVGGRARGCAGDARGGGRHCGIGGHDRRLGSPGDTIGMSAVGAKDLLLI